MQETPLGYSRWLEINGQDASQDKRLIYYFDNFQEWYSRIPSEIKATIDKMIDHFEYYGHPRVNSLLRELHNRLLSKCSDTDYMLFTYLKDSIGRINSSIDYWSEYRLLNGINRDNCTDDLCKINSNIWNNIEDIVIIDDCCCTGKSLRKYIEHLESHSYKLSGKRIFYVIIHFMEDSRELIHNIEETYDVTIEVIPGHSSTKYFCSTCSSNQESQDIYINAMKTLGIKEKPLGFDDSEALIAFYNNTPNNTFPIFWKSEGNNHPVFPRQPKAHPPWASPRFRKSQNYLAAVGENKK